MQKVMKNTPVSRKHLLLGEEEDPMYTEQMKRFREMDQSVLHPAVLAWFTKTFRAPTDVQTRAWAKIAAGKHILMTAPTGSGKTLAAFLWAINQLISGKWPPGATRVLYISPLKALNSDIHKNLQIPLAGIIEEATRLGYSVPNIRTGLRSGDTTQSQRRKMVTTPPEILITTPESLNILLTTKKAEALFSSIETVILDEIHAVASTKRGVHLMSAIERLTLYSDEFQRIGVSATVRPMEAVAGFIGGHHILQEGHEPEYKKREVEIIRSTDTAKKDLTVCFPADAHMMMEDNSWWPVLVRDFKEIIKQRKSTLLFANNRRLTEKLTRLINEDEEEDIAYAHHGSLSKDIRRAVEERLKKGELKAIVATSSLELGIDVGALDQVILVQTPPSISSAMQRLGRAGHQVGALSRGILYPSHGRDFLLAAVCSNAVKEGEIEKSTPISAPLDVLTQIILSMTAHTQWDIDRLYHFIRTISSYRGLPRKQYDLVLQMLAGRYENTRVRELSKRIILDEVENTIIGRPANPMLIYSSGGTIPDRGYYELRVQGSGAKIGELDEEFVWERKIGESFVLGTHKWKITAIDNQKVEVVPWSGRITSNPFWRADAQYRDFTFSERILGFLEKADTEVHENSFPHTLMKEYKMDQESAGELISYLLRQKEHTNTSLPHRHHIVIEHTSDAAGSQEGRCVIIHTLWGGKVNQPVSMALSAALEERYKEKLQVSADDDCIMVYFPDQYEKDTDYLSLIEPNQLLPLVRKRLESSGLFGARFRENAGVALLLPKNGFNKRMPLWLTRLRSKKLYDAVLDLPDFPVLLETWRTCLQDWFDLNTAEMLLEEVHSGEIRVSETETPNPSPFSSNMLWRQINHQMYLDDTPTTSRTSKLDDELIHQAVGYLPSEYAVSKTHVQHLTAKLQRTFPGYQPSDTGELIDWIKQRVFIPVDEYVKLYHSLEESRIDEEKLAKRIVTFSFQGADTDCVCEKNTFSEIYHACLQAGTELPEGPQMSSTPKETDRDILTLLSEYIQYYGPIQYNHLVSVIGSRNAGEILSPEPTAETQVLAGKLIKEDNENYICDSSNFLYLLKIQRKAVYASFSEPTAAEKLPLFFAQYSGIAERNPENKGVRTVITKLFGYSVPPTVWEHSILPSRITDYDPEILDELIKRHDLVWVWTGKKQLTFCLENDLPLYFTKNGDSHPLPGDDRSYSFWEITEHTNEQAHVVSDILWNSARKGEITADTFQVVRKALKNRFHFSSVCPKKHKRPVRGGFRTWKEANPTESKWHVLKNDWEPADSLEELELEKERARLLLDRYGIVFREILQKEQPVFRWKNIFRALRLMELSGEVTGGRFIDTFSGPQFASTEAITLLQSGLDEELVYSVHSYDPASPSGLRTPGFSQNYPDRAQNTAMVFHGSRLIFTSKRKGKELIIHKGPEEIQDERYFSELVNLLLPESTFENTIRITTINGETAESSEYADIFQDQGFVKGLKGISYYKKPKILS